jgi:hypothetical protein
LKEEALGNTKWRNRFGRGFRPVVWQITDDDDDDNTGVYSSNALNRVHHYVWNGLLSVAV